jgi:hypothetical protein
MNMPSFQFLKMERMQVLFILLFIILSAVLMVQLVVIPQHDIAQQNADVRERLESHKFAKISMSNILALASSEQGSLQSLSNEWGKICERLETFPSQISAPGVSMDRIDYKVQLYEIRQRLQAKSGELKIQLMPTELGLDENVASGEEIRVRMLQLKAVEKLADLTLDRQIQRLVEIYPLPPVVHTDKKGKKTFEEYPVRIECDVDFEHLYTFFQSVFEENQVFTFRNLRIESGPTFDAKLRVKAVLSALLFN